MNKAKASVPSIALAALLVMAPPAAAQEKPAHAHGAPGQTQEKLGQVGFPVSCAPAVQKDFERAVALLHSFWYTAAVKAFTAVAEADPGCAMAYWGVAMSWWYPLWEPPSPNALKQGWAAVEKARTAGGGTDRERDYIVAIEAFYKDADKLDHRTRALAYEAAMERLYLRYPTDREAAVFYALALDATALPTDKTYARQLKAGAILEKVFVEQPEHPGVAHYLIHSYDYPPMATRALDASRRYAKIAPSSAHALHMPSHIFTRLGLWQESVQSNADSAMAAKPDGDAQGQLHAMDYMVYAYLQLGQDGKARGVVDAVRGFGRIERETGATAYAQAAVPARHALEKRRWAEAATLEPPETRYIHVTGITYFARAVGAARGGDLAAARRDVDRLQALREALVQAKQGYWADQVEVQRRAAAGWLARADGKNDEAVALLRAAADLEDSTEKHPVTPAPVLPAREMLGDLLLELGQARPALVEYEASLRREPNRFNGLHGAARAAELAGDTATAKQYYGQLVSLAAQADTDRPELARARAFLAK
jgi:tetratricopeptide (TPR) repeat protein